MEIQIDFKKLALVLILLVAALVGALVLNPGLRSTIFAQETVTLPADYSQMGDAQAAVTAAVAFYTLDYHETPEQWAARLCALATPEGCQAAQNMFAPAIYQTVKANLAQTGATAVPLALMESTEDKHSVWQVQVTLTNPWQGLESATQQIYIDVVYDEPSNQWLYDRVLFEEEARERYAAPKP